MKPEPWNAEFTRRVTPPPPDPATFSRIVLTPKKKNLKSGKKLAMTISVTNSGGLAGTATVKITSSSKRKLKVPKTVKVQVPAGRTVKKSFTVRAVKRQKGKVTVTVRLAGKSARSVVTLKR